MFNPPTIPEPPSADEYWELMVQGLTRAGFLQTDRIREAFRKWGRHKMLDRDDEVMQSMLAGDNSALSIGHGQSISQPQMVAIMTELLQPQAGEVALDVGMGSGWQAVLLRELVGKEGKVYGMERIDGLLANTRQELSRLGIDDIEIIHGDAMDEANVPDASFDIITCAAGTKEAPRFWTDRLKNNGRIVYPKQVAEVRNGKLYMQDLIRDATKMPDGPVHQLCVTRKIDDQLTEEFHGQMCRYVPLIKGTI